MLLCHVFIAFYSFPQKRDLPLGAETFSGAESIHVLVDRSSIQIKSIQIDSISVDRSRAVDRFIAIFYCVLPFGTMLLPFRQPLLTDLQSIHSGLTRYNPINPIVLL